jgi:hypothetical protein
MLRRAAARLSNCSQSREEIVGTLRSQKDPQLNYAIRIVEARPYWRMPEAKHHMIEGGLFLPAHRPIGPSADQHPAR